MTNPDYVAILVTLGGAAVAFYVGWRHQSTADAKEAYLMKWLDLVKNLAPLILASVPGVPAVIVPAVIHGILTAEQIPNATGAQKKAYVLDLVQTGLETTNSAAGKQVIETASTVAAVSSGIDATVNAINAVHSVTNPPAAK